MSPCKGCSFKGQISNLAAKNLINIENHSLILHYYQSAFFRQVDFLLTREIPHATIKTDVLKLMFSID